MNEMDDLINVIKEELRKDPKLKIRIYYPLFKKKVVQRDLVDCLGEDAERVVLVLEPNARYKLISLSLLALMFGLLFIVVLTIMATMLGWNNEVFRWLEFGLYVFNCIGVGLGAYIIFNANRMKSRWMSVLGLIVVFLNLFNVISYIQEIHIF